MKAWKFRKRKVVEVAWVLLQSFALLAILFTPLWIRPVGSGSITERFRNIKHIDENSRSDREPTSISSRVLAIPSPSFRKKLIHLDEWSEELESESRQVRFEWALSSEVRHEWKLKNIERQTSEGSWEDVSLVSNEFGIPIGSVYLELSKGENHFTASMENSKTKSTKKISLRVTQRR